MTTKDETSPIPVEAPGRTPFLARFLRAVLRTIFFLVLIILILSGAWFGLRELNRSFASVNTGNEANTQRIDLLRSEVDGLLGDVPSQEAQIVALQTAVAQTNQQSSQQQLALQADLTRQEELLVALELQLGQLVSDTGRIQSDLLALQTNVDANLQQLGEEVNQNQTTLEETVNQLRAEIAVPAGQIEQIQLAISLFRVWEQIARARLQLSENNLGLARLDVEQAFTTMTALTAEQSGDLSEPFEQIRQRLALVLIALPDDPVTAGRDLDTAWEAIDTLLQNLIGGPAATPPPADSLTITPPPSATPTPTATLPPTPIPTPTP